MTAPSLTGTRFILIIEDNPGDVRLMREALRELEPEVGIHVTGDGEEALAFLRNNPRMPRLIFLDFNLPKSDSRQILQELKEDERLRLIPVAVLTTSDAEKDVRDAYGLHANCYLRKPVDLDAFFSVIRTAARFWLDVAHIPSQLEGDARNRRRLL